MKYMQRDATISAKQYICHWVTCYMILCSYDPMSKIRSKPGKTIYLHFMFAAIILLFPQNNSCFSDCQFLMFNKIIQFFCKSPMGSITSLLLVRLGVAIENNKQVTFVVNLI